MTLACFSISHWAGYALIVFGSILAAVGITEIGVGVWRLFKP